MLQPTQCPGGSWIALGVPAPRDDALLLQRGQRPGGCHPGDAGQVGQLAGAHGAVVEPEHGQDGPSTGRETRSDLHGEGVDREQVRGLGQRGVDDG